METWDNFAVIVGSAAAALLGLLFVAISIRIPVIAASRELRSRSAQTLLIFGIMLLLALLMVIPGQSRTIFGVEVVLLAILGGIGLDLLDRRAGRSHDRTGIARVLELVAPNTVTTLLLLAAGVLLLFGLKAGLYLLVVPVLTAFVGGLASAWLFLTRVETN